MTNQGHLHFVSHSVLLPLVTKAKFHVYSIQPFNMGICALTRRCFKSCGGRHKYVCRLERNFSDETKSNDIGDSLYRAGQELGGGMDDATFLKQCGIEVDVRWLAEITSHNEPTEVSNYVTSLLRIADILTQTP